MRILAGQGKGRALARPGGIRPTSDKVKAALFNILADAVPGARFLDVCAGSGAVGLEALSRGAASVTWIERNALCCRRLRDNVERVFPSSATARARVLCRDAPAALRRLGERGAQFELIFVDPPYDDISLLKRTLQAIGRHAILPSSGWLVVEHANRTDVPQPVENIEVVSRHRYGDTALSLCRRVGTNLQAS